MRKLADGRVLAGFAGATADAFTLIERLEAKLEQYPEQLARACVDLAKDWRTDRYLRRLEAMLLVADKSAIFTVTGVGDVLEPDKGVAAIGSGGNYALAAATRADGHRPRRRGDRPPRHGHRRRHLRLHQPRAGGGSAVSGAAAWGSAGPRTRKARTGPTASPQVVIPESREADSSGIC